MTPERTELARAADAEAAKTNPLITEALAAWETEITEAWKASPLRDVDGRERLRLMLEAARTFSSYLQSTIDTGMLQRVQIAQQKTLLQKVTQWAA